jgi:hypothetical protein
MKYVLGNEVAGLKDLFFFHGKTHFCATFEQLKSEIMVQQQIPIQIF